MNLHTPQYNSMSKECNRKLDTISEYLRDKRKNNLHARQIKWQRKAGKNATDEKKTMTKLWVLAYKPMIGNKSKACMTNTKRDKMSNKNMQKMKWVEMYNWVGKNTENQQKT